MQLFSTLRRGILPSLRQAIKHEETVKAPTNDISFIQTNILEANKAKPRLLPPKPDDGKLTVVFQLDEVLTYTFTPDEEGCMYKPLRQQNYRVFYEEYECLLFIYERTNLANFLGYITTQCQPIIFSRAVPSYVDLLLSLIDPQRKIKHVFTQEHCNPMVYAPEQIDEMGKDLNLLNRDLSRTVYLDSQLLSGWLHPTNLLWVECFRAEIDKQPAEDLNRVILELENLKQAGDTREYLRTRLMMDEVFRSMRLIPGEPIF